MKSTYGREEGIVMIETIHGAVIDHAEHKGPLIAQDAGEFLSALIKGTLRGEEELPLAIR